MADINEAFERMIAEMQRYGAAPAPSKGGSYNNMLRYRETREKILERFLAVFADGYRMGKEDDAPTITSSGWVSVEERLPDKPCRVLVRVTGLDILDIDTDRLVNGRWIRWPGYVTHWMLLPAPPDRRPPEGEENT